MDLDGLSVRELKKYISDSNGSYHDCVEKQDLISCARDIRALQEANDAKTIAKKKRGKKKKRAHTVSSSTAPVEETEFEPESPTATACPSPPASPSLAPREDGTLLCGGCGLWIPATEFTLTQQRRKRARCCGACVSLKQELVLEEAKRYQDIYGPSSSERTAAEESLVYQKIEKDAERQIAEMRQVTTYGLSVHEVRRCPGKYLYPYSILHKRMTRGVGKGDPGRLGHRDPEDGSQQAPCSSCGIARRCTDCHSCLLCAVPPAWRGRSEHRKLPSAFREKSMVCLLISVLGTWGTDLAELLIATLAVVSGSCSPCRGPSWTRTETIDEDITAVWLVESIIRFEESETKTILELKRDGTFCLDVNDAYFLFGRFKSNQALRRDKEGSEESSCRTRLDFTALAVSLTVGSGRPSNRSHTNPKLLKPSHTYVSTPHHSTDLNIAFLLGGKDQIKARRALKRFFFFQKDPRGTVGIRTLFKTFFFQLPPKGS